LALLTDVTGDGESDEGQDRTRSNEAFELEHGASPTRSTGWANAPARKIVPIFKRDHAAVDRSGSTGHDPTRVRSLIPRAALRG
jgi:hypothetical protein